MARTFYINFYPNALSGVGECDVYQTEGGARRGRGITGAMVNTPNAMTIEVTVPDPEPSITVRFAE